MDLTDLLEQLRLTALARLVVLLLKHIRDGDIMDRLPRWAGAFRAAVEGSGIDALISADRPRAPAGQPPGSGSGRAGCRLADPRG